MSVTNQELETMLADHRAGMRARASLDIVAMEYPDPCSGCGTDFTPADLALMSSDGTDFYCFPCVTRVYEAMKAAQS